MSKCNLNTGRKLNGEIVKVGDVLALLHIGSGYSYHIVKFNVTNKIQSFIVVDAFKEEQKYPDETSHYRILGKDLHTPLDKFLEHSSLAIVDNIILDKNILGCCNY